MKSLFPSSSKSVETIRLSEGHKCDVYVWVSPEGVKIAAHMIMSCPCCGYPLSLATSEVDFDTKTLAHRVKCPARWKKTAVENIKGKDLRMAQLNEKGRPIFQKCGWTGYVVEGSVVEG